MRCASSQDELADFVPLRLLFCGDILPPNPFPQKEQLMSLTVCAPVTSCLGTALSVCVFGNDMFGVDVMAVVDMPEAVGRRRRDMRVRAGR
jgi:hypothetical protein